MGPRDLARPPPARLSAVPHFEPTFPYEIVWNLSLAAVMVLLGHHRRIGAPGLFALYGAGYSGFRVFEETQRIDYSSYVLGMRLNFWIASVLCPGSSDLVRRNPARGPSARDRDGAFRQRLTSGVCGRARFGSGVMRGEREERAGGGGEGALAVYEPDGAGDLGAGVADGRASSLCFARERCRE